MNISSISQTFNNIKLNNNDNLKKENETSAHSFEEMLKNAIGEVNKEQIEGYKAMEGIATGKVTNLQEAVQQIEEAELSLKLALETKNKAINAFKEITKMQI